MRASITHESSTGCPPPGYKNPATRKCSLKTHYGAFMPRYFDPLLRLLATSADQQLVAQIQFLKAENRILRSKLPKTVTLSHIERMRLLALGRKLRWSVLRELISVVHPNTFARWVRKYKGAKYPREYDERGPKIGRPKTPQHVRDLVVKISKETGWAIPGSRASSRSSGSSCRGARSRTS